MKFFFIQVWDCNFTVKAMTVTSILNAMTVFLLIHFDSCPAETIMIWLTKQMNTSRFQSVIQRCVCETV